MDDKPKSKWLERRYLLAAMAVILSAIAFLVIYLVDNNSQTPKKASNNNHISVPTQTKPSNNGVSQSPQAGAGSSTQSPLSNTGPGNTVALFFGTTAIAGIIHYGYKRWRKET